MGRMDGVVAELYATRAGLLEELAQVEQALALLDEHAAAQAAPAPLGVKTAIMAVLRERGEAASVADVYASACSLGWVSSSSRPRNVVASMLSKLARNGEIQRAGEDSYRLPVEEFAVA